MGSCTSIDQNKVAKPGKTKPDKPESGNIINTYPSIEDVIKIERMKKKKYSKVSTNQNNSPTQRKKSKC